MAEGTQVDRDTRVTAKLVSLATPHEGTPEPSTEKQKAKDLESQEGAVSKSGLGKEIA